MQSKRREDGLWTDHNDRSVGSPEQVANRGDASASPQRQGLPASGSLSPLVAKLHRLVPLNSGDAAALHSLAQNPRPFVAEQVLISEGVPLDQLPLIERGLAYCFKALPGGRRQILGYLIPGDLCGLDFAGPESPDYSVALMSDSMVASVSIEELSALRSSRPSINRAFLAAALVDRAILREWLLNVGQRNAFERLSHFFCELSVRLRAIGLVNDDGSFDLPLNQVALADTTGLTTVHINRTLQRLRNDGLIVLRKRRLTIPDPTRLAELAGFDGEYLNIELSSY
ncbi:MAG: Crp/Fnr family transcriptional regulator [Pseudomonadota bacterium]|nr:Crp/Fnr family transcriptional regulator [Pseudomonadota bacterium]